MPTERDSADEPSSSPKSGERRAFRPPTQPLSYFNPSVAKEIARRERKLRIRLVLNYVGNGLAVAFVVTLCLLWRFGFTIMRLLFGKH